jgi:hypothetical protein
MNMVPRKTISLALYTITLGTFAVTTHAANAPECTDWQTNHPAWLWCDDFDSETTLTDGSYFEVSRRGGFGVTTDEAFAGAGSVKGTYSPEEPGYGGVKFSFGRTQVGAKRYLDRDFEEVYWRVYHKVKTGWQGTGMKMSRATIFTGPNWQQAAIGHIWEGGTHGVGMDPVSGVEGNRVTTTTYNDFANMRWLGKKNGSVEIYAPQNNERWFCIEAHMKLNTPGRKDGIMEFWIDDQLQAQSTNLNWRGSYTEYGINAVLLENYLNNGKGPGQQQSRLFDNFVVSTQRIGCYSDPSQTSVRAPKSPVAVSVKVQ